MVFAPRLNDFRIEQRSAGGDHDPGIGGKARAAMRNDRIGQKLQIGIFLKREKLRLHCVVDVHRVDLGRRLRGEVRSRIRSERDFQSQAITLQHATGRVDHEQPGHVRERLVAMQCALREIRGTRVEIGEDRAIAAALESEAQVTRFAHRATAHLRRLVAIERELRRHRNLDIARPRCRQPPCPLGRAHQRVCLAGSFKSKRSSLRINSTSAEIPSPVRQLVNRNGLSPRMSFESCAISSRLAPT